VNIQTSSRFESDLRRLAARVVTEAGLELVDLVLRGPSGRRVLRVDIDREGVSGVTLEDCQRVSEALGAALDKSDLIQSSYVLEVSSPGADRPIRSADDIRRNIGRRVVVTASDSERGQHSVRGRLMGTDGDSLLLADDEERTIRIPVEGIIRAQQELEL
jgi:ribosome maturation factor RimP